MQPERAEHMLENIRTLMERSQRYEHISGYSGLIAGCLTLLGCLVLGMNVLPFDPASNFALVWITVFAVALAAHVLLTFERARRRSEPAWSRQARTVLLAVLPSFVASLAVTLSLWQPARFDCLPAFWLLLYGCGTLATSFFAPRSIMILGVTCLVLAVGAMLFAFNRPLLTMAVGFGFTHLAFGSWVLFAEWHENRQLAQWVTEELT
jgi:hypothetical protein